MALHLGLGVDLEPPQFRAEFRGVSADVGFERIGQAVRRVGREDQRPHPGLGAGPGGTGRHRGLADAPLSRVQNRPRVHEKASLRPAPRPICGARFAAVRVPNRLVRVVVGLLAVALAAVTVAACGSSSSSGQARTLLKQTFSGKHTVNSGNINVSLSLNPSGSSTIKGPITLSFGGPFASLGSGKLPKSNIKVSISALGRTGSLG